MASWVLGVILGYSHHSQLPAGGVSIAVVVRLLILGLIAWQTLGWCAGVRTRSYRCELIVRILGYGTKETSCWGVDSDTSLLKRGGVRECGRKRRTVRDEK